MMAIDGEEIEAFEGSKDSISLNSLDYDPAKLSEDEKEDDWSHGKSLTTLMFTNK